MKAFLVALALLIAAALSPVLAQDAPPPDQKPAQSYQRHAQAPRHVVHHRHHRKHVAVVHHHRRHHVVKRAHRVAG